MLFRSRVEQTLQASRGTLDALAKLLLEKEVVDRASLDDLLSTHAPSGMAAYTGADTADREQGHTL